MLVVCWHIYNQIQMSVSQIQIHDELKKRSSISPQRAQKFPQEPQILGTPTPNTYEQVEEDNMPLSQKKPEVQVQNEVEQTIEPKFQAEKQENSQDQRAKMPVDDESTIQKWKRLNKMQKMIYGSLIATAILLMILVACFVYFMVTKVGKFPQAPTQRVEVYSRTFEKITYYFFKMEEPSFIRVGKVPKVVDGYVQSVYNSYTGDEFLSKTIGKITIFHQASGLILKAFNPSNIDLEYDLQKIITYFMKINVPEVKRLLLGTEEVKKSMEQSSKSQSLMEMLHKAITETYSALIKVDPSTLQNSEENTFIGNSAQSNSKDNEESKSPQFEIVNKPVDQQSTQLDILNQKQMTTEEKTKLVSIIIEKVVKPILTDLVRQMVQYGPTIADKVGVIFDQSVDLRVTFQKQTEVPSSDGKGSSFSLYITAQNKQVYGNPSQSITDTKTMSERIYSAIDSCTNLDQKSKVCSEAEWFSLDTPFQRTKASQENTKNYKVCKRNKVSSQKKVKPQRKLAETPQMTRLLANVVNCGSVTPNQSGGSGTTSNNQAKI